MSTQRSLAWYRFFQCMLFSKFVFLDSFFIFFIHFLFLFFGPWTLNMCFAVFLPFSIFSYKWIYGLYKEKEHTLVVHALWKLSNGYQCAMSMSFVLACHVYQLIDVVYILNFNIAKKKTNFVLEIASYLFRCELNNWLDIKPNGTFSIKKLMKYFSISRTRAFIVKCQRKKRRIFSLYIFHKNIFFCKILTSICKFLEYNS